MIWMPASGWNGRFMGVGNGGWSGEIWYPFMGTALRDHYATASTDTGHEGSFRDASFALGHPEKLVDFEYRAVHETTIKAKAIITAYYEGHRSFLTGMEFFGRQTRRSGFRRTITASSPELLRTTGFP
jgi:feruloyl esterase